MVIYTLRETEEGESLRSFLKSVQYQGKRNLWDFSKYGAEDLIILF
jgi:hypothetical protein